MTMDPQVPRSQDPRVWAALRGLLRIQVPAEGLMQADGRSSGSLLIQEQDSPALADRRKHLEEMYAAGMSGCPATSERPTISPRIGGGWDEVYLLSSGRNCVHRFDANGREVVQWLAPKTRA